MFCFFFFLSTFTQLIKTSEVIITLTLWSYLQVCNKNKLIFEIQQAKILLIILYSCFARYRDYFQKHRRNLAMCSFSHGIISILFTRCENLHIVLRQIAKCIWYVIYGDIYGLAVNCLLVCGVETGSCERCASGPILRELPAGVLQSCSTSRSLFLATILINYLCIDYNTKNCAWNYALCRPLS